MKTRITFITTLLLLASGVFAQQGDGGQWNVCRLDSIYNYTWDSTTQSWTPQSKILRTYSADRYLTNANVQYWNGSEYGEVSQKDTFSYDANGNFVNDITQIWNGSDWLTIQTILSYNANNHRISALSQNLNGSVWEDEQQASYSYDANGYLIGQVTQTWNASQWQNSVKYTYTNNANGKPTNLLIQMWSNSQWVNYRQYTYTYDANNYGTISSAIKRWNDTEWLDDYYSTFTNNENGFPTEILTQRWNGSEYVNSGKQINYHYCTGTSGIETLLEKNVSVYPSPSNGNFTITSDISHSGTIEVYSITGAKVFVENVSSLTKNEINFSAQAKGIYFVKVSNAESVWTQKVVIE